MPISLTVLEEIVREAGCIAMRYFKDLDNVAVIKKSPRDLVTDADVAVEAYLKQALAEAYPQYGFWGEESGKSNDQTNRWIVDPIDGTHSFAKGQYFWSISVALEIEGELVAGSVYAPALDDLYLAAKGKGATKNGKAISVEIPQTITLTVVETPPNFKGDSQGGKKPATLESGAVVQVPFHVLEGEMIKVDTVDGKYLEKAK